MANVVSVGHKMCNGILCVPGHAMDTGQNEQEKNTNM